MKLTFISENTLQDLRVNTKEYFKHYCAEDINWFNNYFNEDGRVIHSTFEFEMPELSYDDDYANSDRENVKSIYKALKHLPVSQATQERIWAGLAHLQFREFTFYRLKNDLKSKKINRLKSSLFFTNGVKRSLFVHIISRLWWVGYMTYDHENQENPFWLTDFFTEKDFSARSVVFFSSNFTSNREITKGILKSLYRLNEQGVSIKRDHFVQANKYLNVVGGAMLLDMLDSEEVEEMVTKHLCKIFKIDLKETVDI